MPMRPRIPRASLPEPGAGHAAASGMNDRPGITHDDLVSALREIDGLRDVGSNEHPNFQFRSRPFLHFHVRVEGTYADVKLGAGDFEPVWASTPEEREELLESVREHVTRVARTRKSRRQSRRGRR
jgi:hypothetical protein